MISPVVLAFPGNADLTGTDVRDLMEHVPGIRVRIGRAFEVVRESTGVDLLPLLSHGRTGGTEAARQLSDAVTRNVAIFAMSWSYGRLFVDAGLEPAALVGYSLGEITAATVGGIWTLEDAVAFVAERAALMAKSGPGLMLGVYAPAVEMRRRFAGTAIDVAIEVTGNLTVIAGAAATIAEEARRLEVSGRENFLLRVDCAAHSSLLDPYVAEVERLAALRTLRAPTCPIVNGESGLLDDGAMQTAQYWGRHLRRTRRFATTIETLGKLGHPLLVEMGPASLSAMLARSADETPRVCQTMGVAGTSNVAALFDLIAEVQHAGHRLSMAVLAGLEMRRSAGSAPSEPAAEPTNSAQHHPLGTESDPDPEVATVLAILQSTLPSDLTEDEHFFEAGGNSLLAMEALARIESRFGVRVRLREFLREPTARQVTRLLRQTTAAAAIVGAGDSVPITRPASVPTIRPDTVAITRTASREGDLPLLSVQFFSGDVEAESTDRYRLLIDAARSADRAGLHALWFPERHFNRFGGLYPSAALLAAAVATVTERIGLRGGSVVAPLHHPIRIAEEWAMVDNLSGGRAGLSFGSGFVPLDFVLAPDSFEARKEIMFGSLRAIRAMWQGVPYAGIGGTGLDTTVDVLPRPVQPDLPLWLSTTRDIATFVEAGELGVGVLTAMLRLTMPELGERIAAYRQARLSAGHAGPGTVTLMVHTYVGDDAADVNNMTDKPLRTYIRAHMEHTRDLLDSRTGVVEISTAEEEELLDHAQARYMSSAGLFGTEEECRSRLVELGSLGVDEVACLMDFGMSYDAVLNSIDRLGRLSGVHVEGGAVPVTAA